MANRDCGEARKEAMMYAERYPTTLSTELLAWRRKRRGNYSTLDSLTALGTRRRAAGHTHLDLT